MASSHHFLVTFSCPGADSLYTLKKRCGVAYLFDICSQGYLLRLLQPHLILYAIQNVDGTVYNCHMGFLGYSCFAED